jgi:hypothetical protein
MWRWCEGQKTEEPLISQVQNRTKQSVNQGGASKVCEVRLAGVAILSFGENSGKHRGWNSTMEDEPGVGGLEK